MKSSHFVNERSDMSEKALQMDLDHEVQMARQQCYNAAKDAIRIHELLKDRSEIEGLDGWIQSKITQAHELLSAAADALEYNEIEKVQDEVVAIPDVDPMSFEEKALQLYKEALDETTSSSGIAVGGSNVLPIGEPPLKRKKSKKTEVKLERV
jgi:hypothetical protein